MNDLPESVQIILEWAWVPIIGALGGLMGALDRARRGQHTFWSIRTAFGVLASAMMGIISYGFLSHWGLEGPLLGSAVGASGYIGPRAIDDFYAWIKRKGEDKK